ncbi:hypothetical protein SmJEL517_g01451 [Synchytrium microbalum]|uniref:Uncharacterized protein n=1 Tax=Synchytrium microbalum TaxID=1806994 RepID=A0A507CA71_9FUNG|nr:uncharacterized protein SmJEL517_g01451 [Synchytrium microbalum]TPX36381.1 hypothetical protein SmJEL517_g01451 [Synchytrium microbalum]
MESAVYVVDVIDLKHPAGKPHHVESRIRTRSGSDPTYMSNISQRHHEIIEARKLKLKRRHSHINRIRTANSAKYAQEIEKKAVALEAKLRLSDQRRQKLVRTPRSRWISESNLFDREVVRGQAAKTLQSAWRKYKQAPSVKAFVKHGISLQHSSATSFDKLVKIVQSDALIKATTRLLMRLRKSRDVPVSTKNMARVFLSSYMISAHPSEILTRMGSEELGLKELADSMLRKFEAWVAGYAVEGSYTRLQAFLPAWEAYHSAFEAWKNKDTDKIIDSMIAHWIELEKLWLSVKDNAGAELEWRPRVDEQQRQIHDRLSRFGRPALLKLADEARRVRAEFGLLEDSDDEDPKSENANHTDDTSEPAMFATDEESDASQKESPKRRKPSRREQQVVEEDTSMPQLSTSPERFPGLATSPKIDSVRIPSRASPSSRSSSPAPSPPLPSTTFNKMPLQLKPSPLAQNATLSPQEGGSPVASLIDNTQPQVDIEKMVGGFGGELTNEGLAHELVMDPEFELRPAKRSPLEEQVRSIAKKAFFDAVRKSPKEHMLLSMVSETGHIATEIKEKLDLEMIQQQISKDIFDLAGCIKYILSKMAQLCAPIRDAAIRTLAQIEDPVHAFEQILNVLEEMKLDLANYRLQALRPHLAQQAVEYERAKFDDALTKGSISLEKTTTWLETSAKSLQEVLNARDKEGISHPENRVRFEDVYHDALLSLIFNNTTLLTRDKVPETLLLDADRLCRMQNEAQAIIIVASLIMLSRNAAGELRGDKAAMTQLKETLFVLLEDGESTVDHLAAQIVQAVSTALGKNNKELEEAQITLIKTMVEKTLSHKDAVFTLLSRRAHTAIKQQLVSSHFKRDALTSAGLDLVGKELEDLSRKVYLLAKHNKEVHAKHYDDILKKALF